MNVKLLVVHGRPRGKSLLFPPGEYVFGRGTECHIRPNSDWVSRQHCMLRVLPDVLLIRDLGSRNGTLVNGVRVVGEQSLQQGDMLQVGPLVFEVQIDPIRLSGELPGACSQDETGLYTGATLEQPAVDPEELRRRSLPQSLSAEMPSALPPAS
jgi:predicted component of type VI protein secretion system